MDSESRFVQDWVKDAVTELRGIEDELESLETINRSLPLVVGMLTREQMRAVAAGILKFEIVGLDDPVIKGFAVPLPDDVPELTSQRQRAPLIEPVRQALQNLSPNQFEALWILLIQHLGGERFELRGKSGDGGIDFTAEFNIYRLRQSLRHAAQAWLDETEARSTVLVIGQAKHWPNRILPPAILRELAGTMYLHSPMATKGERRGSVGMLVTTGRFSSKAEFQARSAGIILLDGEWVASAIINFGVGIFRGSVGLQFSEAGLFEQIDKALASVQ